MEEKQKAKSLSLKAEQLELFPKQKTRWDYIEWFEKPKEKSKEQESKGRWCGCCYERELDSFVGKHCE
ncbi:MAG: hypothetical protein N3G19_01415 [Candidatus Pacearchaeota archaeon]|nr:hypothetical protein [Candidatus Pacearchaeota archaeon]